jgi:hypothetical protein
MSKTRINPADGHYQFRKCIFVNARDFPAPPIFSKMVVNVSCVHSTTGNAVLEWAPFTLSVLRVGYSIRIHEIITIIDSEMEVPVVLEKIVAGPFVCDNRRAYPYVFLS